MLCHCVLFFNMGSSLSLNRLFRADDSFQDFMNTYSIVTSDGSVLWMFPAVMKTYCTLDVRHFPFDRQHCKIIFISWTFNGFKLNVTFNASEHQTVYYTPRNQVLTSLTPLLVWHGNFDFWLWSHTTQRQKKKQIFPCWYWKPVLSSSDIGLLSSKLCETSNLCS